MQQEQSNLINLRETLPRLIKLELNEATVPFNNNTLPLLNYISPGPQFAPYDSIKLGDSSSPGLLAVFNTTWMPNIQLENAVVGSINRALESIFDETQTFLGVSTGYLELNGISVPVNYGRLTRFNDSVKLSEGRMMPVNTDNSLVYGFNLN